MAARRGASASGSGGATGWPATDWVEDMMLRTQTPGDLRQVGHQRDPVHRSGRRRRDRGIRLVRQERQVCRRRCRPPWPRPTSATARRASSPRRRSATCTTRPRSSRPSSRRARNSAQDADFFYMPALCLQAGPRQAGSRRRHAGDDHQGLAGGSRLRRVPEDADRARSLDGAVQLPDARSRASTPEAYANDADEEARRDPAQLRRPSASTVPT